MILGVDIDGVLAKYNEALALIVEEARELPAGSLGPPEAWSFPNWGLTEDSFRFYHTLLMQNIVDMDPYEGCEKVLRNWTDAGNSVRIVTSRGSLNLHDRLTKHKVLLGTIEWLDLHKIPYDEICFVEDKTTVFADLYIEDSPGHLKSFVSSGKNYLIFDHLYNRAISGNRVSSWTEVEKYLRGLK